MFVCVERIWYSGNLEPTTVKRSARDALLQTD